MRHFLRSERREYSGGTLILTGNETAYTGTVAGLLKLGEHELLEAFIDVEDSGDAHSGDEAGEDLPAVRG